MDFDELLTLSYRERVKYMRSLSPEGREAILQEERRRQQVFMDSYEGPVHHCVLETGGCIDPYPEDD